MKILFFFYTYMHTNDLRVPSKFSGLDILRPMKEQVRSETTKINYRENCIH